MATIGNNVLTLADWAKRIDPDGNTSQVVELLSQTNDVLEDMLYIEGNLPTGHQVTQRTGLPTAYWKLLNQGVQPSKSTTAQVTESCGILEAWSEIAKDVIKLNGNSESFMLSESSPFVEAMGQEHASTLFYGNSGTAPEEFTGLAVRYSDLSANNAQNIVVGGGSDVDNSSIWLVGWGEKGVCGIFPKGSKAGIDHNDIGWQTIETSTGIGGTRLRAYQNQWQWKTGLAMKDWRYTVRIPNIDISALVSKTSAADLIELMIKATHRIPNLKQVKPVFYMNRTCYQMLDIQARDDVSTGGQLGYTKDDVLGHPVMNFRGIPIRLCDALLETEALVS